MARASNGTLAREHSFALKKCAPLLYRQSSGCVRVMYCDVFIFSNNTCEACVFDFFFVFVFFLRNGFFTEEKTNDCSF